MKILCTGDLHLGRRSTKIPEPDSGNHSACRAWSRIVELAIAEGVECVALTGDIFDKDHSYIQACGPLEKGLIQLHQANIPTFAVAGNHDHRSLPEFAKASLPGFTLLGADGKWQSTRVNGVEIWGVSFVGEYQSACPVKECNPGSNTSLVLAHADLDVASSRYAPVSLSALKQLPATAVLLGHVHKPRMENGSTGPLVLNPGSPQALDPTETGIHGPWIVEMSGGKATARQIPISSVQYCIEELDLSGADDEMQIRARFGNLLSKISDDGLYDCRRLVSVRLVLKGRTSVPSYRSLFTDDIVAEEAGQSGCAVAIEKVVDVTRPALDIDAIALKSDPPGLLAQMMLAIESGSESSDLASLLDSAASRMQQWSESKFKSLEQHSTGRDETRSLVLRQGYALLDALVRQQEDSDAG